LDCIFCGRFIDKSLKSKEHIIPDCIGGRLKCQNVCRECNSKFGTEFERDLIESFGLIQDFLGLKSDGRNPKVARFSYKGRRVRLNKEGAQLVDTRYVQKENGTREHFFPNIITMRKYYEKEKLKDPTIDVEATIRNSEKISTEINSPLVYKTKFPFEKIICACAKMIYEFLFSIRPDIKISSPKFRDFINNPDIIIDHIIYNEYSPYHLDNDQIYHKLIIEARTDQKAIFGYVELYSSFKILFLIDNNYLGPPFLTGYYFDLMEAKGYYENVKKIPINLNEFLKLSRDFDFLDYADELGDLMNLAATKARLFPIVEELMSVKSKIIQDDFVNKKEMYLFIIKSMNAGLKRIGIEETLFSKDDQIESLNEKIIYTLSRLKSTFLEWNISLIIIDDLINIL